MKRLLPFIVLCLPLCAHADDASDASQIFAVAEQKYDKYFKPAGQPTQTLQGYLVRYYPVTNTYLGVREGSVYVMGQQFGVGIIRIGKVSDFVTPATTGSGSGTSSGGTTSGGNTGGTTGGSTNTGSTSGGNTSTGGTSTSTLDITDLILSKRTSNCADYAGSYKSTATDFTRSLSFTGNLAVTVSGTTCTFTSNNIPNHTFGQGGSFATPVSAQSNAFKVTTTPAFATQTTALSLTWNSAVLLNGVRVDMLAAACYGVGDGKIGCDNESQAWRYEALSPKNGFGTDNHNAHVQPDGAYHYHGNPKALFDFNTVVESPVVGFAADGFPLFGSYFKDSSGTVRKARSSYRFKTGSRPTGTGNPGGTYDGTYRDDYEFVSALGDLDACNGMTVNNVYGYYITDDYPYMTNCFRGTPDTSFRKGAAGSSSGGTSTGGTNTGGTSTGGTNTGSTTSVVDITDLILSKRTSNCADYAGTYKATAKDFTRNLSFTGNLAVTVSSGTCTFTSNDIPNHTFGQGGSFATQVSTQNSVFKMTNSPSPATSTTAVTLTWNSAVLLNGVRVDMFAAACYGVGDGKIGCDNESQAWRYDPMSPKNNFGTDNHNAHVQPDGSYHYHGNPKALFDFSTAVESPVVGFAADGYPLFGTYFKDSKGTVRTAKASYRLKTGSRPTGSGNPGGTYDGTYRDDYEYVSALGDLDACNGMTVNGVYGYYITDAYPYMTNCFKGTPDSSFRKGGSGPPK